jgi:hypothetical protein
LSDVLNSPISICLKLRKEFGKLGSFDNFIEEESIVVFKLVFLALNIKKINCGVLDFLWEKKRI